LNSTKTPPPSPADNDDLGAIDFYGETSTGATVRYAYILSESRDVVNADAAGSLRFEVRMDNVERNFFELQGYNGSANEGRIIFNQEGQDVDFRIEGVGEANALFVQGSNGFVGIHNNAPDYELDVAGNIGMDEYRYHNGDPDTYDRFQVDRYGVVVGGVDILDIIPSVVRVNEGGADVDFRIEGVGEANAFFLRGSDGFVGIGTNAPNRPFEVSKSGVDATSPYVRITNELGAAWNDGDIFGGVEFYSNDTSGAWPGLNAYIYATHATNTSGDIRPSAGLEFGVSTATALAATMMTLAVGGDLLLGTPTLPGGVTGKTMMFGTNAGNPNPGANTAGLFAKDVGGTTEQFAVDEAGNVAQLTAHPQDAPFSHAPWAWIPSFENDYIGRKRWYNIEELIADVAAITGKEYIYEELITRRDWYAEQARQGTRKGRPAWMEAFD